MDRSCDNSDGCPICATFVSGLKRVYDEKEWNSPVDGKRFPWSFRDRPPHFPGLTESASRGCPWCSVLRRAISVFRSGSVDETQEVTVELEVRIGRGSPIHKMPGNIRSLDVYYKTEPTFTLPYSLSFMSLRVLDTDDFNPLSSENAKRIREAIRICARNHQKCPRFGRATGPSRVVNVMDGDFVRLENSDEREITYAALSYCWGRSTAADAYITLKSNLPARMEQLPLHSLPKTLQDAVWVARSLKIQYLWIDALCIVQDCKQDWTREAQKMMQYYGNAYVTIVPVLSESADSGMQMGTNTDLYYRKLAGPWSRDSGSDLILSSGYTGADVFICPWNERGWTYQEQLNSARILFMGGGMVTLECRQAEWNNLVGWNYIDRTAMLRFLPVTQTDVHSGSYSVWREVVSNYTSRRLKEPKDQFFAFSGIMDAYLRFFNCQIIAGLWKDRIVQELVSWSPPKPMDTRDNLPSWTWLSAGWSSQEEGIDCYIKSVEWLREPCAKFESVVDDGNTMSVRLQISGVVLDKECLLSILDHYRGMSLPTDSPGRGTRIAYLDHAYPSSHACSCTERHESKDCESYSIASSLFPSASALLIGLSRFEWPPGVPSPMNWHFLLMQSIDDGSDKVDGLPKFRRIGTLHIPEDTSSSSHPEIMAELKSQVKKSVILV